MLNGGLMKIIPFLLLILLLAAALVSCSEDGASSATGTPQITAPSDSESAESNEALDIYKTIDCKYHHRDYHLIPYHLIKHVGVEKSNEWAKEARKSIKESAEEGECICPELNIKSYIDYFKISSDDFIAYGDMVYYATHDIDVLFGGTPEDADQYYVYSDALIDKTITSQHFEFIEKHFKYEYYSELSDMVIYDDETGVGIYPSIPTLVQSFKIDRSAFEVILSECTDRNVSVYGRSFNFNYDLDMIYNEDGSFKELPKFDGMSEYQCEMKLNRIFCGIE